jgi:regulator of protease activity HflC (stomatin/prohibitin superfamily)
LFITCSFSRTQVNKDQVSTEVFAQLGDAMKEYGYEILNTLVTDLSPDNRVKASMNEINASRRLKEAASHKAEADKVKQVKAAEAVRVVYFLLITNESTWNPLFMSLSLI